MQSASRKITEYVAYFAPKIKNGEFHIDCILRKSDKGAQPSLFRSIA